MTDTATSPLDGLTVEKLRLEPGDIIVVTVPATWRLEQLEAMERVAETLFVNHKVVIKPADVAVAIEKPIPRFRET